MVIIFGAGGFVGYHLLCRLLQERRGDVLAVDRRAPEDAHRQLIAISSGTIEWAVSDELSSLQKEIDKAEALVCLAGATSVDAALAAPIESTKENLDIAISIGNVLLNCRKKLRAIYMSSDEVLGASNIPLAADAQLLPTQPYAASKAAAEIILHNWRDVYNLHLLTLRSCNLVGSHQRKPKLIPTATCSLARDEPVPVHGSGEQRREWLGVEDLCEAIMCLLLGDCPAGVYQAASGHHLSVNEVVRMVAEEMGLELSVKFVADRQVQDENYCMNADTLIKVGWRPKLNVDDDIRRAIRWYARVASGKNDGK